MKDNRKLTAWVAQVDELLTRVAEDREGTRALLAHAAQNLIDDRVDIPSPTVLVLFEGSDEEGYRVVLEVFGGLYPCEEVKSTFDEAESSALEVRKLLDSVVVNTAPAEDPEDVAADLDLVILEQDVEGIEA